MRFTVATIILLSLVLYPASLLFAQDEKQQFQLGVEYFKSQEYDKAEEIFRALNENNPDNQDYFIYFNACLVQLKKFSESEKNLLKRSKKEPDNVLYSGELGWTYFQWERTADAEKTWNALIERKKNIQNDFSAIASFFRSKLLIDWEIKTYLYARKTLHDDLAFSFELAYIYAVKNDFHSLAQEYLRLLRSDDSYLDDIESRMSVALDKDEDYQSVESEILLEIQKSPNYTPYQELLIWLYLQQKNYSDALVQAKALDRLNKEQGFRIYSIAQVAEKNGDFSAAFESYDYIIQKYPNSAYYIKAYFGRATTSEAMAFQNNSVNLEQVRIAVQNYTDFISHFGESSSTREAMYRKANLLVFYLYQLDEAEKLLNRIINLPVAEIYKSDAKLLLGDIHLIKGEYDEAKLIYSDVEQKFKDAPAGSLAKLKNSKLDYFMGDFDAANARLTILKRSTSTEISNDALQLSLFIQDNTGLDSSYDALQQYARAELFLFQNRTKEALALADSLFMIYSPHPESIRDDLLWMRVEIFSRNAQWKEAVDGCQKIISGFGYDILADDAAYKIAQIYDYHLNDKQKAMELYQDFILKFPGSVLVTEARKRFRELRGDKI